MNTIKSLIDKIFPNLVIAINYFYDYKQYSKYNYKTKKVTYKKMEGKIFRQTHIIEKGMSLSNPRKGFGIEKINLLLDYVDEYCKLGYPKDSTVFLNAIHVIKKYITFQNNMGVANKELEERLEVYAPYFVKDFVCGIKKETKANLNEMKDRDFLEFLASRHSMRQFADSDLDKELIRKAVKAAMFAPSECNRQSVRAYLVCNEEKKRGLDNLINGNTGFAQEVKGYMIITSDSSCYTSAYERNQLYIDGSLFAMVLMLSLHYFGIASCPLQHSETKEKTERAREIIGFSESERIVMYLAIGNYKETFSYAVSKRKNIEEIYVEL